MVSHMNIHESRIASIRVDSRLQRNLNRTCVQRIENAHETRKRSRPTNTRAFNTDTLSFVYTSFYRLTSINKNVDTSC